MAKSVSVDDQFDIEWNDEIVETNEISPEDEKAFLKEIIGKYADEVPSSSDEPAKRKYEYKPLHESVTERYFTGERELKAVHDEFGSLWHVEMVGGGMMPLDLQGKFTSEQDARAAIKLYLAKKNSE